MALYAELARLARAGEIEPGGLRVAQLDEYIGVAEVDPRSLFGWLGRSFSTPLGIGDDRIIRLRGDADDLAAACREWDAAVAAAGAVDIAILGLGPNGHLGFNEPPSAADAPTRAVTLTEASLASNAGYWADSTLPVPRRALTAGMGWLLGARHAVLVVTGANKRDVLRRLLSGPIGPDLPGSLLRTAPSVVLLADRDAWPDDVPGATWPAWDTRTMPGFRYAPEVVERFPAIVGGVIHATGVTNGPTPPALRDEFDAAQAEVRARIGDTPLSELPALAAWRRAFRAFGVDPTQYRSAAEALLRRLTKQGELPSIGTLVDLGNLVSIRAALPVAVFDTASLAGGITVRFARGDERWADLGASTTERPAEGEVIFADDANVVVARRWCWRQSAASAASAAREGTTDILVTVEGHHDGAAADVAVALDELERLLRAHAAPQAVRRGLLTTSAPAFE